METGLRYRRRRAVERRHDDPAAGRAVRGPILRPRRCGRARNPRARADASTRAPTGISSAPTAARAISMGWHPESGLIAANWVGYNEGMMVNILALGAPVHPAPADLWEQWTAPYPQLLARRGADAPPRLRAAVRAPVQPHLHRLPRHPRRADARRPASTISRTAGARPTPTAPIASPIRCAGTAIRTDIWGLTACDGPGDFRAAVQGREADLLRLCRARAAGRARRARRRHDRADGGARLAALRAGDRHPLRRGAAAEHGARIFDSYGFRDSFNPSFTYHRREARDRLGRSAARLGRDGLSRHRPGADPASGRQLPRRFRLAVHAPGAGDPARPEARRIHRRLARLISGSARRG